MKKLYIALFAVIGFYAAASAQNFCNMSGNLIIYSNYDGGELNINIDQNIPDIKIGVVSYEFVHINITGAFAGNVTEVRWAGYNGNNNHCSLSVPYSTTITGVANNVDTIINYPPAGYSNPNGYNFIICNYSCDNTTNQGGCNTPDQIVYYFQNAFPGSVLYYHHTQYGCWNSSSTFNISSGGNCCILPTGLDENGIQHAQLEVFPNPSNGDFHFSFAVDAQERVLTVTNLLGETVETVSVKPGAVSAAISLVNASPGIYFVKFEGEEKAVRIVVTE
jgi:hypothetical protein